VTRFSEKRRSCHVLTSPIAPISVSRTVDKFEDNRNLPHERMAKMPHPTGSVCSTLITSPTTLTSLTNFLSKTLCGLYLNTCPTPNTVFRPKTSHYLLMVPRISIQSSKLVASGFSHIICSPSGASAFMT
jgi:hypothetical protein